MTFPMPDHAGPFGSAYARHAQDLRIFVQISRNERHPPMLRSGPFFEALNRGIVHEIMITDEC